MRIGILSAAAKAYSTKRLKAAAKQRGHTVKVIDYLKYSIFMAENQSALFMEGKKAAKLDAVIPRIGASATVFGSAVVRQFEQMGIYALNGSYAIGIARDKLRTIQVLGRHGIGIPPTACVHSKDSILPAVQMVGGDPVIIKLLQGTQGVGVILAESTKSAEAIIETLQIAQQNVLIQKFVSESRGRDIRAFVVGDRVVAAMRRTAQGDEFRSNVHRGGLTEAVQLSKEYVETAIRAAHIIGLHVAGVDILESDEGPKVMEVNASPGLEGIEEATGVDVADAIIAYLEEQVLFPHFEISERLALSRDFAIYELPITATSILAKKTLEESALAQKGIQVLCIIRKGNALSNPAPSEKALPGDLLLCYGQKGSLKTLLPQRLKRLMKNETQNEA
ncbi:MAG: RimK family alpha-L-glutamate ligase [Oligoflexia bacterium]|nr:RimK family alpha-L-glutamate ligase [Oligoflexia bacterium]